MFNQDEINISHGYSTEGQGPCLIKMKSIYPRDTQPRVKGCAAAGDERITEH